jgi:hypothetical protein
MCAFLASFWIYYGRAALVNVTIEDSSPLVQYNCTVLKCDADTANTNPCGLTGFNDRTLTLTATGTACEITIPFSGELSCFKDFKKIVLRFDLIQLKGPRSTPLSHAHPLGTVNLRLTTMESMPILSRRIMWPRMSGCHTTTHPCPTARTRWLLPLPMQ